MQCDLTRAPESVMLDPIKITQVIRNVLDNTLRYAKGFTLIRIGAEQIGEHLVLTIEDDGCGIPEKDLPHIFERFYTVDKGRSREQGGTGLGLSIVKHIVQLHGGQVSASNLIPCGVRVECRLPLKRPL